MPLSTFKYMIGKTIKKDMNIARFLLPNQIIAKIINDATGVALMTDVIGSKRARIIAILLESAANSTPATSAAKNPPIMRNDEYKSACQKSAVAMILKNVAAVFSGDAKISSEPK